MASEQLFGACPYRSPRERSSLPSLRIEGTAGQRFWPQRHPPWSREESSWLTARYSSGQASGENRVVEDEIDLLRSAGHEVRSWTPEYDQDQPRLRGAANAVWSRTCDRMVKRLIAEARPEVVHVHNVFPTLSPSVLRAAGDSHRIAVVMTIHNFRLACLPRDAPQRRKGLRGLPRACALERCRPWVLSRLQIGECGTRGVARHTPSRQQLWLRHTVRRRERVRRRSWSARAPREGPLESSQTSRTPNKSGGDPARASWLSAECL